MLIFTHTLSLKNATRFVKPIELGNLTMTFNAFKKSILLIFRYLNYNAILDRIT